MQVPEYAICAMRGLQINSPLHQMGKIIPSLPRACAKNNTIWVTNSGMRACS